MSNKAKQNIVLGICGSIAAYKSAELCRLMVKAGHDVRVVMTKDAGHFISPLTLSTLSGNPCLTEFYSKSDGSWNNHVAMAEWADKIIIAPATAQTIAKLANGFCDNLLTSILLSAGITPIYFAPAMDLEMYRHQATQENIQKLKDRDVIIIDPEEGELASGLVGQGRMAEPEHIYDFAITDLSLNLPDFTGYKVMISAGPTREAIDPVRYIGNLSSGKMGFELAKYFARAGAEVKLISGPATSPAPVHPKIELVKVTSADEMFNSCMKVYPDMDITVMAAAVADFTPENYTDGKIKKGKTEKISVNFKRTKDILAELGKKKRKDQFLVGFSLETDNEVENAKTKLKQKKLNLIVLNSLNDKGAGFGFDTNKISIIGTGGAIETFPLKTKSQAAVDIIKAINRQFAQ